jgi:hypothetical protein
LKSLYIDKIMKSFMIVALLAALCSYVMAECNNMCSGHGVCSTNDMCLCYRNYRGADCSERTCQYGRAFVDSAQGDLNHDGVVTFANSNREKIFAGSGAAQLDGVAPDTTNSFNKPEPTQGGGSDHLRTHLHVNVKTQWAKSTFEAFPPSNNVEYVNHVYMECSNKGLCDRTTGECACFDGYEGSACQRTVCPNKCSGHGVCRSVADQAAALPNNANFTYNLWDGDKIQGCVCDPGYQGYDCSERQCPSGDDPLEGASTNFVYTISLGALAGDDSGYYQFKDQYGDVWRTKVLTLDDVNDDDGLAAALIELPNKAVPSCTSTMTSHSTPAKVISLTMTSNPGVLLSDLTYVALTGDATVAITQGTAGAKTKAECSSRGLCDYETGICSCFRGYRGEDCSTQSALAF